MASSRKVQESMTAYKTDVKYPETALAQRLKTVAQLIDAGLGTRVYYLDLDGFDTHANQAAAHAGLLAELSGAVAAFVNDLDKHGHGRADADDDLQRVRPPGEGERQPGHRPRRRRPAVRRRRQGEDRA